MATGDLLENVSGSNYKQIPLGSEGSELKVIDSKATFVATDSKTTTPVSTLGGVSIATVPKKINIGAVHRWDNTSYTSKDKTGDALGNIPLTWHTDSFMNTGIVNVYPFGVPIHEFRREFDNVHFGQCIQLNNAGQGGRAEGTENLLNINEEHGVVQWFKADTYGGYIWASAYNNANERYGFKLDSTGEFLQFKGYDGTTIDLTETAGFDLDIPHCIAHTNYYDGTEYKFKYAFDGVMGTTDLDTVRGTQPVSSAPITIGARIDGNLADDNLTTTMIGLIGRGYVYGNALTDRELTGAYWNVHGKRVVCGIGSSSMYGEGPATRDEAIFFLLEDYYEDNDTIWWDLGVSGSSFYEGLPTGSVKPSYVTTVRPAPVPLTNITRCIDDANADAVMWIYPSNFTITAPRAFTEGPRLSSEYIDGLRLCNKACAEVSIPFFGLTPGPMIEGKLTTTGDERSLIQKQIAEDILLSSLNFIDMYVLAGEDNFVLPQNIALDLEHYTGIAHQLLFGNGTRFLNPLMGKVTEKTVDRIVTNKNNYTIEDDDGLEVLLQIAETFPDEIFFPTAKNNVGREEIFIQKVDTGTGAITLQSSDGALFQGQATFVITKQHHGVGWITDGINWFISSEVGVDTNVIYCNQTNVSTTLGATIDPTKIYRLTEQIDLGTTEIDVTSTPINIDGYTFVISGLSSSEDNYTMFKGVATGDVLFDTFSVSTSGLNSQVYDLKDSDGTHAFEINRINYNNCTSRGTIDNYRQGLETGTGYFGGSPNLILKGVWSGGYLIATSIVRSLDAGMTGALYEAGVGFTMASRFKTNMNCDLPASAAFLDFAPANFLNPSTLQIQDAIITRNGVSDPEDANLTPNISSSDIASQWSNNTGLGNTFEGGTQTVTTEIATVVALVSTFYTLDGTYTATDLQHFDAPANGQTRHLGNNPREYLIVGNLEITSVASNVLVLRVKKWDDSASAFVTVFDQTRPANNLVGPRDVAFFNLNLSTTLDQNDYIFMEISNDTAANNATVELTSYFSVRAR